MAMRKVKRSEGGRIAIKLKKNDTVAIIAGKEKGKTGRILRIDRERRRAVVEGLNMVKKAMKPRGQNQKGGIVSVESSLHLSNLMIVCKKCGPTRIGYSVKAEAKTRVCRKCKEQV